MPNSRRHYDITPEDFVTVWSTSTSVDEVVQRLSRLAKVAIPRAIVIARASHYRGISIPLKKMNSGSIKMNRANLDRRRGAKIAEDPGVPKGKG